MNNIKFLLISAIFAALATGAASVFPTNSMLTLFLLVFAACLLSLFSSTLLPANTSKPAAKPSKPGKSSNKGFEEGQVKWFNPNKGFGFIVRESGEEIFVHYRSIVGEGRRSLRDGQRVQFKIGTGDKGLQAEEVSRIQ